MPDPLPPRPPTAPTGSAAPVARAPYWTGTRIAVIGFAVVEALAIAWALARG